MNYLAMILTFFAMVPLARWSVVCRRLFTLVVAGTLPFLHFPVMAVFSNVAIELMNETFPADLFLSNNPIIK